MIGLALLAAAASVQPKVVLTIDPRHRLVEGVASDGKTIWVSSILDRQVLACRKTCRTFATLPAPLHSSRLFMLQRRLAGVQAPVHRPALQATAQVSENSHALPLLLQISTALAAPQR